MWGITLIASALVLGLIAFSFAFGAPILAVPIAIVGVALIGVLDMRRRRRQANEMHHFREQAKAESVEFTPRDKETLVSE
jgi:UDP-N-acetylmuramyl pentapeptide phosphotransferase/UDP-N-acetylglucosamine-1-phosphate transferase